jgi:GPH family glycoside/pentoside/hexuronide:cation symporter
MRDVIEVSNRTILSYSSLAIPLAILNVSLGTYLPSFYAAEVGISMSAIGLIMFCGRIWDAVVDPLFGYLSDKTRLSWGRRKPWVLLSAPALMLAIYLCFVPPTHAPISYVVVVTLLIYSSWGAIQIPYLSWGVELSHDYGERTRIAGFREAGSMVGVVVAVGLPILVFGAETPRLSQILLLFTAVLLLLIPLSVISSALWCKDARDAPTDTPVSGLAEFANILKNRPFVRFLVIYMLFRMAWSGFDSIFVLLFTNYLKTPGGFLPYVFLQYGVSICCAPLIIGLSTRFGKHRVLALSLLGGALVAVAIATLIRPGHIIDAVLVFLFFGITNSALWILPTAIVGDVVDYGKLVNGGDNAGGYLALLNVAQKFGLAVGVGLFFPLLDLLGFSATTHNDASGIAALRWVAGATPPLLLVPAALALWGFPIDRRRQAIIRRRLTVRVLREGRLQSREWER